MRLTIGLLVDDSYSKPEGRFRILIADDDEGDIYLLRRAFGKIGVEPELHIANNGEEVLDALSGKFRPHLILLDLNMPLLDGKETLIRIKRDPSLRKIPVLVLSSSLNQDDVVASYELGANSFVAKPDSFDELVEVVSAIKQYWFGVCEL